MLDQSGRPYIAKSEKEIYLVPKMANRHGLIAGATGTGKTVSLQVMAETFSAMGVPVFVTDIKGDLSGISKMGTDNPKINERVKQLGIDGYIHQQFPVCFWDIYGEQGHPLRTTISEMGPLLLSRLLDLNDIQSGVLSLVFKIADSNGLLLLDMKDLRKMLEFVGENKEKFTNEFGNISPASIGAIQRGLVSLEEEGAEKFFGEPALNILDFIQTDKGKGVINVLTADKLMMSPRTYSTFLLWMLSELFEELPEAGDLEKPKLVFFFDEAHLLFNEAPKVLLEKIEQVVRLVRSKGVGIYFITQNPLDVPDTILGQLGNRIQHALRAFTPRDQKAVKAAAETFRSNPKLNVEEEITQLGVGEALVSFLDEKGIPGMVEKAKILPPQGQIGPITPDERANIIKNSLVYGVYDKLVDRESAFEILQQKVASQKASEEAVIEQKKQAQQAPEGGMFGGGLIGELTKIAGKSVTRQIGNEVGRQLVRGLMGSLFGGSTGRGRSRKSGGLFGF
ncbi:MAG TPA: helicase HerA-like domain-containing protein [Bacteroidales bacterium]|nr:helicase HerA-like domain-containing protein [Bacteroidales bacterium]